MMTEYDINPFVRLAMCSVLRAPFHITERIIFDYELIYVESGGCDLKLNGNRISLNAGDILLIPPGVPHSFRNCGPFFSQPHIHFDLCYDRYSGERFINYKKFDDLSSEEKRMIGENVLSNRVGGLLSVPDRDEFLKRFFAVVDHFSNLRDRNEMELKSRMSSLLSLLSANFTFDPPMQSRPNVEETVRAFIDRNYRGSLSLDGLATQFFVNKFTLLRRFKAAYGGGVMEYVRKKKIEGAMGMLREGHSVSEIAERLHFDNLYSFSRCFRTITGKSPTEFGKQKEETPGRF